MGKESPRLLTIFAEALEKKSPEARAEYLDRACRGDKELRQRVEALIAARKAAGGFLGGEDPGSDEDEQEDGNESVS